MECGFTRAVRSAAHLGCLLIATCVVLSGCSSGSAAPHADPGTLIDLERTDGATMNPLYAQTAYDGVYDSLLFDGLTNLGADLAPHPGLATAWTHSPDGLHWDVTLRRGVRWSDGEPFTSKDVVFSYRIMLDPKTAYSGSGDIDYIHRIVADGPYRVHFDLTNVSALFVSNAMGLLILPAHVLGAIPAARQPFSSFGEHPVGTGPYMLERWQHDSDVLFRRNPHYWHGVAKIPRIDFRIIFNDQAEVDAIENGSADMIGDLGYTSAKRLQRESPRTRILSFPSLYVGVMEMNLLRPGLKDVVVRRALMYCYDREAVVHGFFDNHVEVMHNLIVPALTHWYNPNVRKYPYDPARARAILAADGWKLGPDGVRRKGTTQLHFEILVNQGSVVVLDQVLAFAADAAAVGIKLDVRQIDFPSAAARTYAFKYDIIADARGGALDPDWTSLLASNQRPPAGANTTGYADPGVDRDLRLGLRELDDTKRRAIYDDMQVRLAETLPMLWQYGRYAALAYSPRVRLDPKVTLQSPLLWYNVADWELVR